MIGFGPFLGVSVVVGSALVSPAVTVMSPLLFPATYGSVGYGTRRIRRANSFTSCDPHRRPRCACCGKAVPYGAARVNRCCDNRAQWSTGGVDERSPTDPPWCNGQHFRFWFCRFRFESWRRSFPAREQSRFPSAAATAWRVVYVRRLAAGP